MEYRVTKMCFRTKIQICYKRLNTSIKAGRSLLPFTLRPYYQRDRNNNNITKIFHYGISSLLCNFTCDFISPSHQPLQNLYDQTSLYLIFKEGFVPNIESNMGLTLTTLRPRPELRSKVSHLTDWAIQAPGQNVILKIH